MVAAIQRTPVESPQFTPLPYGLFSVASFPTEADPHWQNGVFHEPDACGAAGSTLDTCVGSAPASITKSPTATGVPIMGADPFTVYSYIDCGPVGRDQDAEDRAITALENGEARAVERVFWTGSVTTTGAPTINPHLAEDSEVIGPNGEISQLAAQVLTSGPVDIVEGLGLLEGALADCYGGVGVIHAPRRALAHMSDHYLVTREDGHLETLGGLWVAAGGGYPGTAPTGGPAPTDGVMWLYATGSIEIFRSGINLDATFAESINRSVNNLVLIAERTYVITWDCCLFAAQVRLGGAVTGAVGSSG